MIWCNNVCELKNTGMLTEPVWVCYTIRLWNHTSWVSEWQSANSCGELCLKCREVIVWSGILNWNLWLQYKDFGWVLVGKHQYKCSSASSYMFLDEACCTC